MFSPKSLAPKPLSAIFEHPIEIPKPDSPPEKIAGKSPLRGTIPIQWRVLGEKREKQSDRSQTPQSPYAPTKLTSYFDVPIRPANPEPQSPCPSEKASVGHSPSPSPSHTPVPQAPSRASTPLRPALKRFPSQSYADRPAICRAISEPYGGNKAPRIITELEWLQALAEREKLKIELETYRVRFETQETPQKAPSATSGKKKRFEGLRAKAKRFGDFFTEAMGRYLKPKA